jgi:hypothetical protein
MSGRERPAATEAPEPDAAGAATDPPSPERYCPACGRPLIEWKCKLLCPDRTCGYYMSCSDFY